MPNTGVEREIESLNYGRIPFVFSPARFLSFLTTACVLQEVTCSERGKGRRQGDIWTEWNVKCWIYKEFSHVDTLDNEMWQLSQSNMYRIYNFSHNYFLGLFNNNDYWFVEFPGIRNILHSCSKHNKVIYIVNNEHN